MTSAQASPATAQQSVEVMTSLAQCDSLAESWADLGEQRWGPLASHEWFSCAARAFCPASALHVIVVRRMGRLAAVAPLCRVSRRSISWLEIIGNRALFEPLQLPAADDRALDTLCAAIVSQRLPVCIERLETDDRCIAMLRSQARSHGTFRVLSRAATHFLPQGMPWAHASGRMADYRRKKRKLEAQGTVTTSILAPRVEELASVLDTVFRVEAAGWKGRGGTSISSNRRLRTFFTELCAHLAAKEALRICFLQCSGQTLAAQICVEQERRFWVLKMGFDEHWARFSPGMLLTSDTIRYALEDRRGGFEFLGVGEGWQRQWRPQERAHCAAVFYPACLAGMAALAMDTVAAAARPLRKIGGNNDR